MLGNRSKASKVDNMIHVHEPVHENVIMVYEFIVQINKTPLTDPMSYDL